MPKILVIDDDPHCREMLRVRLKKEKYDVIEANDGEEGLNQTYYQRPHLIILDIRIPKVDGWEVCRRLKNDPRTMAIPVMMLTGCSQDIQERYGRQCGADEYIVKPWEWPLLLSTVHKMLSIQRSIDRIHSEPIKLRMRNLAQKVMQITSKLPQTDTAGAMAGQLARFATTALAAYEESGGGTLQPDFLARTRRVKSGLDDLAYWLGLLQESTILPHPNLRDLIAEAQSLADMMAAQDKAA